MASYLRAPFNLFYFMRPSRRTYTHTHARVKKAREQKEKPLFFFAETPKCGWQPEMSMDAELIVSFLLIKGGKQARNSIAPTAAVSVCLSVDAVGQQHLR